MRGTKQLFVSACLTGLVLLSLPLPASAADLVAVEQEEQPAAPNFGGVTWVTAMSSGSCGLRPEWDPAFPSGVVYNVYRCEYSPCNPGNPTWLMVEECVTDLYYVDTSVFGGTNYWYVVRAEGSTPGYGGPCNDGEESTPLVEKNAVWNDAVSYPDFGAAEGAGWMRDSNIGPNDQWDAVSGNFQAPDLADIVDHFLISPEIRVGPTATLVFRHKFNFAQPDLSGGVLEITVDGNEWFDLGGDITQNGYIGPIDGKDNPLRYRDAWIGVQDGWIWVVVDLEPYAGNVVKIRWRMGCDTSGTMSPWEIDDISVDNTASPTCTSCPDPVPFLTVRSTHHTNLLEWINPGGGIGYTETIICASANGFPITPCASPIYVGGQAGMKDWLLDQGLENDVPRYYSAFTRWWNVDLQPPAFQYSPATSVSGTPFDSRPVAGPRRWAFNTGATALAPPAIGSLFGLTNSRGIHGMETEGDPDPGSWPDNWAPMAMDAPAQERPFVVNIPWPPGTANPPEKKIFVSSQDGHVYAITETGGLDAPEWVSADFGMLQAGPAGMFSYYGGSDDTILVGTRNSLSNNEFLGLDAGTGATERNYIGYNDGSWHYIGIISGAASVDYASKNIYFASRRRFGPGDKTLWCISLDTVGFAHEWALDLGDIDGSPILWNGLVIVGTNDGVVYARDAYGGGPAWAFDTQGIDGAIKGYIWPDFDSDAYYFSTTNYVWRLVNQEETYLEDWKVAINGASVPTYVPDVTDLLYVGSSDGSMYELNADTGAVLGSVLVDSTATIGSPSLDTGTSVIYFGTDAGAYWGCNVPLSE